MTTTSKIITLPTAALQPVQQAKRSQLRMRNIPYLGAYRHRKFVKEEESTRVEELVNIIAIFERDLAAAKRELNTLTAIRGSISTP
jgi:hypothetical protein